MAPLIDGKTFANNRIRVAESTPRLQFRLAARNPVRDEVLDNQLEMESELALNRIS